MDVDRLAGHDFDDLARSLAATPSRRGFLRLLVGGAAAAGLAALGIKLANAEEPGTPGPIDPRTGQPMWICRPACGPCHECTHASYDEPTCTPTCNACSFCDADTGKCVSSCSGCEECKAGICQSTCPDCKACENGACRPCSGPCEQCVDGRCFGCDPDCETCDAATNTCTTKCAGGFTCCNGTCLSCCSACNHATGVCTQFLQGDICSGEGDVCCFDRCTHVQHDEANCGECRHQCMAGDDCCNGVCSDTREDPHNCGVCTTECGTGFICCIGQCVSLQVAEQMGLECCPNERRCADRCCPKGQFCAKPDNRCDCPPFHFECTNAQGETTCCPEGQRCCNGQCQPVDVDCCPPGQHAVIGCQDAHCCPDGQSCRDGTCQPDAECPEERTCFDAGLGGDPPAVACCPPGQICDEVGECQVPCNGDICYPGEHCCEARGCEPVGWHCCPPGQYETGSTCGPACCPDDKHSCNCVCKSFNELCF